ncbi:MAG: MFS transporter [Thermoplasmata archaeon]
MVEKDELARKAYRIIFIFGIVSLCGDIIYEGARSVNGPYLEVLGANAAIVGIITGIGEFLGYAIRLVSGYFSDRSRAYWVFAFIGYGLLISVPLLALSGIWQIAAIFLIAERIGKGIRSPAKDTIISQVSKRIGRGMGFGIHEALDQIGAFAGPLIFTAVFAFYSTGLAGYRLGYLLLLLPLLLCILALIWARKEAPRPEELEALGTSDDSKNKKTQDKLTSVFWLYLGFTFLAGAGFASFALIGYHIKVKSIFSDTMIPVLYAVAMGVDAGIALAVGKLYDKKGFAVLFMLPVFTAPIAFLAFSTSKVLVIIAVILWGCSMGTHETILRAAVADLTSIKKRGTGYGIFNTAYGLSLLASGAVMGVLYEISYTAVYIIAILTQVAAAGLLIVLWKKAQNTMKDKKEKE